MIQAGGKTDREALALPRGWALLLLRLGSSGPEAELIGAFALGFCLVANVTCSGKISAGLRVLHLPPAAEPLSLPAYYSASDFSASFQGKGFLRQDCPYSILKGQGNLPREDLLQ